MKILVLCTDYPDKYNLYKIAWAHARNVHYLKAGFDVTVLNFSTNDSYVIDGVKVETNRVDKKTIEGLDVIISHSPNIRKHLPFLIRNHKVIKDNNIKIFIFSHGSESLYHNRDYPKPYSYNEQGLFKCFIREVYDRFKMFFLKRFILFNSDRIRIIFVSNWMKKKFISNVKLKLDCIPNSIIHNCLSSQFYKVKYDNDSQKSADFITIRKLDESKYAIDLVIALAEKNPSYNFHIYGKGEYFKYNSIPSNVIWFDDYISQEELPFILNKYKCALMPTRVDAQGVMACEIASFGMPMITTSIEVMQEMVGSYINVTLLPEADFFKKIKSNTIPKANINTAINSKFSYEQTIGKEIELFC